MIELRFHRDLYRGESVDSAIRAFERFASFERAEEGGAWVVRVRATRPEREAKIARELANWALGETIRARTAAAASGG